MKRLSMRVAKYSICLRSFLSKSRDLSKRLMLFSIRKFHLIGITIYADQEA